MSKKGVRGYIVQAVIFIAFSVIAFAIPFPKNVSFWIAYIFGVIAIAYQIYAFKISFSNGSDVKSKFYGFPIVKIGLIYMIVQLILSLIEIAASAVIPVWLTLILDIILVALALIGCTAADAMREEIERQDVQIKRNVSNMRELQFMASALPGQCADEGMKKKLQELADDIRYSDPVSGEESMELENELKYFLQEINKALSDGDTNYVNHLFLKTKTCLNERNRVCKLQK